MGLEAIFQLFFIEVINSRAVQPNPIKFVQFGANRSEIGLIRAVWWSIVGLCRKQPILVGRVAGFTI